MKYKDIKHIPNGKIIYHLHHLTTALAGLAATKFVAIILFILARIELISGYTWLGLWLAYYISSIVYHEVYKKEKKS